MEPLISAKNSTIIFVSAISCEAIRLQEEIYTSKTVRLIKRERERQRERDREKRRDFLLIFITSTNFTVLFLTFCYLSVNNTKCPFLHTCSLIIYIIRINDDVCVIFCESHVGAWKKAVFKICSNNDIYIFRWTKLPLISRIFGLLWI